MIASLIRFSIKHAGVIVGLAFIVIAYGIYQIKISPLNVFPEFSPTQVIVQTEAPGFSSSLVETLVSKPIEQAISGTIGVKQIRSQSIPGLSVITVIFDEGTDIYVNRQAISERFISLKGILPKNIIPNITPLTSSASSVLGIGITSKVKAYQSFKKQYSTQALQVNLSRPLIKNIMLGVSYDYRSQPLNFNFYLTQSDFREFNWENSSLENQNFKTQSIFLSHSKWGTINGEWTSINNYTFFNNTTPLRDLN